MRSFILLLCLIPTIICAQNFSLEDQLKQAIKGKKAEIKSHADKYDNGSVNGFIKRAIDNQMERDNAEDNQ